MPAIMPIVDRADIELFGAEPLAREGGARGRRERAAREGGARGRRERATARHRRGGPRPEANT